MDETLASRLGLRAPLRHVALAPLDADALRRRAPHEVHSLITYDRHTMRPGPGGLFDEAIFGEGASLELLRRGEEEVVVRPRSTRFGRIALGEETPHPVLGTTVSELPVLPPDLRPIVSRDGELVMANLNVHYHRVLVHGGRLRKLREIGAPPALLDRTRGDLAEATAALLDNERQPAPHRDAAGKVIASLRGLLRPDPSAALASLDEAAGRGLDVGGALPLRLHRTVAALFAMGIVVLDERR